MRLRSDRSTPVPLILLLAFACLSASGLHAEIAVVRVRAFICTNGLKTCTKTAKMAFAPADVVVEAVVPAHKDNRRIRIGLLCGEWGDLNEEPSEYQIDGEDGPKVFRWEKRRVVEACNYTGYALVDSATSTRGSDAAPITVISPVE